jgi:phosphate-selective porin
MILLTVPAPAADVSVEDRLNALEQQVRQLAQENAELKKELGRKEAQAPVLVQPAGKETRLALGGFLQAQGEFGRAADPRWAGVRDRFFFRRARIYVLGSFAEDFDFKGELELQGNTLGAGTGLPARANEIYINWHRYPAANVRFGQIKPAFGAEQLASDTRLFAIERSQSNDRLTDVRQLGVSLGGELFDKRVSYLVVVGDGSGTNASGNDNSKFQKSVHVSYTARATREDRLVFGTSGLWTEDSGVSKPGFGFAGNLFTGNRSAWGLDAEWTHGRLDLFAEYLRNTFKPTGGAAFDADGWQATAAYFLVPARVQALLRCEEFDPDKGAAGNTIRSWTLGVNYLIKGEDLRLMLDYIHGTVPGSASDGGRVLTRMQVLF